MNPRKRDEKRKRELILYMLEHHDVPENLDQEDIYALKRCSDAGYVENLKFSTMASGRIVFDIQSPKITDKGIAFLNPKKDYKFIISSVIAVIELIVIVLQALLS